MLHIAFIITVIDCIQVHEYNIVNKLFNYKLKTLEIMKTAIKKTLVVLFFVLIGKINSQTDYPGDWSPEMENWGLAEPCISTASPWHLGGDYIVTGPNYTPPGPFGVFSASNFIHDIGTCNDFPFVLKANNLKSVFIGQTGLIGINNAQAQAALDVKSSNIANQSSFRIHADVDGNLESTTGINMNFAQGKTFKINEGTTTNNLNWFSITSGGNVGLGTNAPTAKLSLEAYEYQTTLGANVTSAIRISNQYANSFGTRSELQFALGQNSNQEIAVIAAEYSDYNNGVGGDIVFGTAKGAVISEKMRINYDGQVWVGKRPTTGIHSSTFNFAAEKILAKEIYVTLQGNWADYVFDKNYKLPKLSEVESFYQKNHHLPEIPSAKEVGENGISVGDMNALLLKKIEELTLYVVSQQKEIEGMKEKIK